MEYLKNSRTNKGLSFSDQERQNLGIQGLLPPAVASQEAEAERILENVRQIKDDLQKYIYLINILNFDERLFYRLLESNTEELMPIVYTPTVGNACLKYSFIYIAPRGLFIRVNDKGSIYDILGNWPVKDVKVIVVTDGERILGLGDLGSNGMGIPVGKLALYTALAGVDPSHCLPIQLDVGTNNERLLNDKYYFGLRHKRVNEDIYYEFLEEFMQAVKKRYGPTCLIQFEDFGNSSAFKLLDKYQNDYCTYNDDIQGTASVVVAGLLSSTHITNIPFQENVFLLFGAGEASLGIANLIVLALQKNNLTKEEAINRIWLVDSKGLIVKNRPSGGLTHHKIVFAKDAAPLKELIDIVDFVKPTVLLGSAAVSSVFTKEILEKMSVFNEKPVVFALSNPTSKAECTAIEAYNYTNGRVVFASGSPFDRVFYNDKYYNTSQANNCYIFPAIGLAIVSCGIYRVANEFFLVAAESLSNQVTREEIDEGRVYPNLKRIREVSFQIACDVAKYAFENGLCSDHVKPENIKDLIRNNVYNSYYN